MNLAKALVAPRKAALRLAERDAKKALSPSQSLGGIYIPTADIQAGPTGAIQPDTLVLKGWKANVYAYTGVKRVASAAAQVYWRVEERTGDGPNDWQPRINDWRNNLLNYPTGNVLSAYEVFFHWGAWIAINGNGLLRKILGGPNGVLELWPMSPQNVQPVLSRDKWVSGYNIIENGEVKMNFSAEEIIHARLVDPANPTWGFGMIEAAWPAIQAARAQSDWRVRLSQNGGSPPAAITDDGLSPFNIDETTAILHAAWRRNSRDGVPMVLGSGKNVLQFGFSPADMMVPEDREMTRDEIANALGIHPAMFSNDSATYDNQDSAIRFMYENGAGEILSIQRDSLNGALLTDEERESDSVYVNYDLSPIPFFRRQREAKIAAMGQALKSGISRDDYVVLSDLGLAPAEEGGDTIFVESGLVTLAEASRGVMSDAAAGFNSDPMPDIGAPVAPDPLGLPSSQDVQVTQDAVLNGAQITAATAIVQAVAVGDLPRDAGIGQLMVLFNLEASQAELMMGSAGQGFVAQSTVAVAPVVNVPPPAE